MASNPIHDRSQSPISDMSSAGGPSSAAPLPGLAPTTTFPMRRRAIDAFHSMPSAIGAQPPPSSETQTSSQPHVSPTIPLSNQPPRLRAKDLLLPAKNHLQSEPSIPEPATQQRLRANNFFKSIPHGRPILVDPSAPSTSAPRAVAHVTKRASYHEPKVDVDLTMDISESDEEESTPEVSTHVHPPRPYFDPPDYIFNTNDVLATRQTIRGWNNSADPTSWGRSWEEFHADQVELDRQLPAQLDDLPSYVSHLFIFRVSFLFIFQAISEGDMQSLHRYVMARYDITTYDEYIHLLALFRNTNAIETQNAYRRLLDTLSTGRVRIFEVWPDPHGVTGQGI